MTEVLIFKSLYDIKEEPVLIPAENHELPSGLRYLRCGKRYFPASVSPDGVIAIITAAAGEELELIAECDVSSSCDCETCQSIGLPSELGCAAIDSGKNVTLMIDGHIFASYEYSPILPKPHLGPILDNSGNSFTRCDPMNPEHPHQRSLIVAIGEVNDADCWNERDNCGFVRSEEICNIVSSSAYAGFTAKNRWTAHDGTPLMTERTTFTVYNQSEECRTLDMTTTFTADYGDVVFGPTKEAGPLGIRVRDEMRADTGCGKLYNSNGQQGEPECWGKTADWCDYSADIDGIGKMGITIFDNPTNFQYPTAWHIRAYGLFAANNFYFKGGFTLSAGDSITYKYRILFRREDMDSDSINGKFAVYAAHASGLPILK